MARIITDSGRGPILPPGAVDFLHKRLAELVGFALLAVAGLYLTLLLSYTPLDPSFNNATDSAVRNLMGLPGAYAADLIVQGLGAAGALPALLLAVWGWRIAGKRGVSRIWRRMIFALVGVVLLAVGLSAVPTPASWPLATGLGGAAGGILLELSVALLQKTGLAVGPGHVALVVSVLGLVAMISALGLSRSDWRTAGHLPARTATAVSNGYHWGRDTLEGMGMWPDEKIEPTLDQGPKRRPRPARKGLVEPKTPPAKTGRRARSLRQGTLNLGRDHTFELPPLDLLEPAPENKGGEILSRTALQQNARMLSTVLEDFGIRGEIVKVRPGPVVTLYELEPAPGTKTSRVIGLSDDIARSMSAVSVRVAVVPGRNVIGIELPNIRREMVHLRELLSSDSFERNSGRLPLCLGKDISGSPVLVDLARMPHLLIAGTTGSGKSVGINTMILSLLYRLTPDECKLIMIDPKMLELSVYEGIPHLLTPVVTEAPKAVMALKWTVREMEERYRSMSQLGVRNITGYNARLKEARRRGETLTRRVQTGFDEDGKPVFEEQPLDMDPLPLIVVVVDEMADLMMVAGKDIEATVQRLAQMARAAGIHLIMATQRPSVDVITGTIKANFPTRLSFQVTSKIDSRTILGEQGAEQLLGQGDMLYMEGGGRITRIHGPFVSDEEVEDVVKHLKAQGSPSYIEEVTREDDESGLPGAGRLPSSDDLYEEAVALITREGKASTSFIQRHLQIGYNRAARIIEAMEKDGVVSPANRVGRREVLIGDSHRGN